MIHHQHYFPVVDDEGKLKPAFLAVTNMQAEKPEIIARNSERVLTARLRDARFFWDEDRKATLESRIDRLVDDPVPQEAGQLPGEGGSRRGAGGVDRARGVRSSRTRRRTPSRRAGCARPTSPPTWCASSPSCRARWAASTRARRACPRQVWKAIYFHYLPIGVEADAPPSRQQLGRRGGHVGGGVARRQARLGRRHVHGRRAADRLARSARPAAPGAGRGEDPGRPAELTGLDARIDARTRCWHARRSRSERYRRGGGAAVDVHGRSAGVPARAARVRRPQRPRGACTAGVETSSPLEARRKLEALAQMTGSAALLGVAALLKRVKNITKGVAAPRRRRGATAC